jgi:hypothetical protein
MTQQSVWSNGSIILTGATEVLAQKPASVSLCPSQILPGAGLATDRQPEPWHGPPELTAPTVLPSDNSYLINPLLCKHIAVPLSSWQLVSGSRYSHQTYHTRRCAITSCHLTQPKSVQSNPLPGFLYICNGHKRLKALSRLCTAAPYRGCTETHRQASHPTDVDSVPEGQQRYVALGLKGMERECDKSSAYRTRRLDI